MTKADIVMEIAQSVFLPENEVLAIVEGFMAAVKDCLANGEDVCLSGFGNFVIKHRAEKPARNIHTGETVIVPAHDIPFFKPSQDFLKLIK